MKNNSKKRTFEQKFGYWLMGCVAAFMLLMSVHWWQDALMEDARWIDSCHTMDSRVCGPGEPWIRIQIGGTD